MRRSCFEYCEGLEGFVTIPADTFYIDFDAFDECYSLNGIHIGGCTYVARSIFGSYPSEEIIVYGPAGANSQETFVNRGINYIEEGEPWSNVKEVYVSADTLNEIQPEKRRSLIAYFVP